MAMNGTSILLLVDVDPYKQTPSGSPDYQAVAEQTSLSTENSTNLIEASHKGEGHTKWIAGRRDGTITLEALYVPSDDGYKALKAAQKAGDKIMARRSEDGTEIEEVELFVSSIGEEFPDNDSSTISAEFQKNGDWTTV